MFDSKQNNDLHYRRASSPPRTSQSHAESSLPDSTRKTSLCSGASCSHHNRPYCKTDGLYPAEIMNVEQQNQNFMLLVWIWCIYCVLCHFRCHNPLRTLSLSRHWLVHFYFTHQTFQMECKNNANDKIQQIYKNINFKHY